MDPVFNQFKAQLCEPAYLAPLWGGGCSMHCMGSLLQLIRPHTGVPLMHPPMSWCPFLCLLHDLHCAAVPRGGVVEKLGCKHDGSQTPDPVCDDATG